MESSRVTVIAHSVLLVIEEQGKYLLFPSRCTSEYNIYRWVHLYQILNLTLEQEDECFREMYQFKGDNTFHRYKSSFLLGSSIIVTCEAELSVHLVDQLLYVFFGFLASVSSICQTNFAKSFAPQNYKELVYNQSFWT